MHMTAHTKKSAGEDAKSSTVLVAYFSATGNTKATAETLAKVTGGDLYEIEPQTAYTRADLDWHDHQSRSTIEMNDPQARPTIKAGKGNIGDYDTIYIGYPIWWYVAPRIINTFIESYDLKGKTLIPFATSGSSSIAKSVEELKKTYPEINWQEGRLLNNATEASLSQWIKG